MKFIQQNTSEDLNSNLTQVKIIYTIHLTLRAVYGVSWKNDFTFGLFITQSYHEVLKHLEQRISCIDIIYDDFITF